MLMPYSIHKVVELNEEDEKAVVIAEATLTGDPWDHEISS